MDEALSLSSKLLVHKDFAQYFNRPLLTPYLYLLSKKLSEGSVCVDLRNLDVSALKEAGYLNLADEDQIKKQDLVSEGKLDRPFILWHHKLYFQRYFKYEKLVFERIRSLIQQETQTLEERKAMVHRFKERIRNPNGLQKGIDWQLIGALQAAINNFTIITGGPGTGKTTSLAMVLSALFEINPGLKVALTAPTGKAAHRMMESLQQAKVTEAIHRQFLSLKAFTIERLLGYRHGSIYFTHNSGNPLPYDWVIADEASMLDMAKFSKLLDAVDPQKTRVILLGDKDQLASVEAGSLFGDLCLASGRLNLFSFEQLNFLQDFLPDLKLFLPQNDDAGHLLTGHIIELKHSHRFREDVGIGKFSRAVIQNDIRGIKSFFEEKDDEVFIDEDYTEDKFREVVQSYAACLRNPLELGEGLNDYALRILDGFKKQRILCAVRQGEQGISRLNERVEQGLKELNLIANEDPFYEFRPVLITRNDYDLALFNGDIGVVLRDEEGTLKVFFETNDEANPEVRQIKRVSPALIDDCETCFAMTIHKSQGSEFDYVFLVLPKQKDLALLTRELIYTGLTRAKQKVVVQSTCEVLLAASQRRVNRGSGIKDRFLQE